MQPLTGESGRGRGGPKEATGAAIIVVEYEQGGGEGSARHSCVVPAA